MSISVGCGNCLTDITTHSHQPPAPANQPIAPINRALSASAAASSSVVRHIMSNGSSAPPPPITNNNTPHHQYIGASPPSSMVGDFVRHTTTNIGTSSPFSLCLSAASTTIYESTPVTAVIRDGVALTSLPTIIPYPTFQIKPEANTSPTPIRSLSVHSLPGTLTPSSSSSAYDPRACSTVQSGTVFTQKREMCDDSNLLMGGGNFESHSELFRTYDGPPVQNDLCSTPGVDCSLPMFSHSTLLVPLRSADITDQSLLPLVAPGGSLITQPHPHSPSLSPLPSSSSTQVSSHTLLYCPNNNPSDSGTTFVSHGNLDTTFNSTNAFTTLHQDQSRHHQFTSHHPTQQQQLNLLSSHTQFGPSLLGNITAKRTMNNGNYPTFTPCGASGEMLLSSMPGVSPRSKARRYSYPHELIDNNYSGLTGRPYAALSNKDYSVLSSTASTPTSLPQSCSTEQTNHAHVAYRTTLDRSSTPRISGDPPLGVNGSEQQSKQQQSVGPSSSTAVTEELLLPLPLQQHLQHINPPQQACSSSTSSAATAGDTAIGIDQQLVPADLLMDVQLPGFNSPESAFYQYQHRMEGQRCQVCGELAAGFHHGAYVCEACKKFFMRHSLTDTKPTNVCPTGGNCVVVKGSRGKCQICRFRKCLYVGMKMKDPDSQSDIDISTIPCRVCGGRSSGFHFGALTCEGCKGFFRRTESSAGSLVCVGGQNACTITPRSRNACKSCRFRRCIAAGMSKKGSRIGRQPNAVKFHCAIEIQQLRSLQNAFSNDVHLGRICSAASNAYTSTFGLDVVQGARNNRISLESPKYDPDALVPIGHRLEWGDEEYKPPLSLLLLLPQPNSDPIDTTAVLNDIDLPLTPYTPSSTIPRSRLGNHADIQSVAPPHYVSSSHSSSNLLLRVDSGPGGSSFERQTMRSEQRSTSDEEDVKMSPVTTQLSHQCFPNRTIADSGRGHVSLAIRSLLCPSDNSSSSHNHNSRSSITKPSCQSPPPVMTNGQTASLTTVLIANLAKQLADAEDAKAEEGGALTSSHSDEDDDASMMDGGFHSNTSQPPVPSQDAILRFIDGMRTATEFLRLPNTYFKTRFRMSSIPLDQQDDTLHVWNHMMNHFHMHAQQIVQFAKLVPGFNNLGITARSNLVRGAMYPVVLLLLSRDYEPDTDEYNYFDFTADERVVILKHFPSFVRITEHLRMAGRLLHHLGLSLPELSLSSAVEILRNYQLLEEPTRSNTKELFLLAHHSLRTCMTRRSDLTTEADERHRWAQLCALSKMIQAMNREHHEILADLKELRPDLHFPELYVEMFQLADRASALFSVSAKAVTLACSTALQQQQQQHSSDPPLSLCPTLPHPTSHDLQAPLRQQNHFYDVEEEEKSDDPNTMFFATPSDNGGSALPSVDRWDAGRFALAVPAAVAALSAVAAAEASHHQQQHFNSTTTSTCQLDNSDLPTSSSTPISYFPMPRSSNVISSSSATPSFYFPYHQNTPQS